MVICVLFLIGTPGTKQLPKMRHNAAVQSDKAFSSGITFRAH